MFHDLTMPSTTESTTSARAGLSFLSLFVGATLLGSLISPHVFNLLVHLGRRFPRLEILRDLEFESVSGRCVMLLIFVGFFPAVKLSGIRHVRELGFVADLNGWRLLVRGFLLGLFSLGLVFLLGWAMGAYVVHVDDKVKSLYKVIEIVVGALVLSFFEETLVRGFMFGTLRKSLGLWTAAFITSVIFMIVHFARPELPVSPVHGHWDSGLSMIPHMFYAGHDTYHYFPHMITLSLMGLVLCLYFDRFRHIGLVIGMHAGWVVAMRFGGYLFDRSADHPSLLFGQSDVVSKSYAGLLVATLFLLWILRRNREAVSSS
jgi:membrane protease YdiL (CAAX protease family)